jgi:hypothetical protein
MHSPQPGRDLKEGLTATFMRHQDGKVVYPRIEPAFTTWVFPVWDDTGYFTPLEGFKNLEAWPAAHLLEQIDTIIRETPAAAESKKQLTIPEVSFYDRKRKMNPRHHAPLWAQKELWMISLSLAENSVAVLHGKRASNKDHFLTSQWLLALYDRKDGKLLSEGELSAQPVLEGAIFDREGNIIVSLDNGTLECWSSR